LQPLWFGIAPANITLQLDPSAEFFWTKIRLNQKFG